jgi:ABC-type antimicrobial peptide transport system permease subunit
MNSRPARSRLRAADLVAEAIAGVTARPARTFLTAAGVLLGVGAMVATLGLSQSAGNRIVGRFDALAATQVIAEPLPVGGFGSGQATIRLPWDGEKDLQRLNGVVAAGAYGAVSGASDVRSSEVSPSRQVPVMAVTPGLLEAIRGTITSGRFLTAADSARKERVVVLGREAAEKLGITGVEHRPAVTINGDRFVVVGILGRAERESGLLDAVLVPVGTAQTRFAADGPQKVVIETVRGAARLVASQAALALNPNEPSLVRVTAPAEPRRARGEVRSDVSSLFLVLGFVSLVVGTIGIANVTLVNVLERVGEIGLRRALGAARRHIALQFLVESGLVGFGGGVAGASLGVLTVVTVAWSRSWTPVLEAWVPLSAPFLGLAAGLLAGAYPAFRAASLQPVEALRLGS